jgi:hypothetical protein
LGCRNGALEARNAAGGHSRDNGRCASGYCNLDQPGGIVRRVFRVRVDPDKPAIPIPEALHSAVHQGANAEFPTRPEHDHTGIKLANLFYDRNRCINASIICKNDERVCTTQIGLQRIYHISNILLLIESGDDDYYISTPICRVSHHISDHRTKRD